MNGPCLLLWGRMTGVLLLSAGLASTAMGQDGVISGRVTAEGSGTPIAEAQLQVVGTNLGATSAADGRYTIRGVIAGAVEVRAIRIGFMEQKLSVNVAPGATQTLNFTLRQAVIQLQEVVTTATGQQRRESVGATIPTIDASALVSQGSVTGVADLLAGKAPGASVLLGSMTGTAGTIRLRGLNSISLSNAPIWIVDGIRFNAGSMSVSTGGQSTTLLTSLNPEEIETLEVVKGPAAATLYGTGAANGVIVVTTKRGRADNTRWNWYTEQGQVKDKGQYPESYMIWGHTAAAPNTQRRCELVQLAAGSCIQDSVTSFNPMAVDELSPLKTGSRSQYGLQVSGGTAQLRYFVSGDVGGERGPITMPDVDVQRMREAGLNVRPEWKNPENLDRVSLRTNLNSAVNDKFDISVSAMYGRTNQRLTQTDNNTLSIFYQTMMNPGFRGVGPGRTDRDALGNTLNGNNNFTLGDIFQYDVEQEIHRFVSSMNGNWRPLSWFTADATLGMDLADRRYLTRCRFGECAPSGTAREGTVSSSHNNNNSLTARLVGTATWQLNQAFHLSSTIGADYTNIASDGTNSSGTQLPPGAQTVGAAAVTSGGNTLPTATKTLGYVLQERLSINDRLFFTAAARTDQNSAFGVNYKNAIYPSAEASWVASSESFFPEIPGVSYLRLRAAYGTAGVNPGATSALDTYSSPTVNIVGTDTPGLRANQLGNPDLKPEISTEFETGFDTRLLGERVNLEVTYYHKKTRDALLSQPIAASSGASDLSVLRNMGAVQNDGLELSLNTALVSNRQLGWNITFSAATNRNRILSLGDDPATGEPRMETGTGTTRNAVGMPISGRYNRPFSYSDLNGDGYIDAAEVAVDTGYIYIGSPVPRKNASLTNTFEFLNRQLRLNAMFDYKGGYLIENVNGRFLCTNNPASAHRSDPNASLDDQARCVAALRGTPTTTTGYFEKGDFVRLREISATYKLPPSLTRVVKASDASLSLSGRNLALWTSYTGADPEQNYSTGDVQANIASSSPRSFYTLRINLSY